VFSTSAHAAVSASRAGVASGGSASNTSRIAARLSAMRPVDASAIASGASSPIRRSGSSPSISRSAAENQRAAVPGEAFIDACAASVRRAMAASSPGRADCSTW
jgi:hypothetical protein